ncbi:MAG: hypothetical protein WC285_04570 [Candidatus Gracilibacteria bacterium]|jgi:hypothetical protein
MRQTWKIFLTLIVLAIIVGGGVYYWQGTGQAKPAPATTVPQTEQTPAQESFIDTLLAKLPDTYIVSEVDYLESFGPDAVPQKATEVKPCQAETGTDPAISPLCYTSLTILEEQVKTNSLDEYIEGNKTLNSYKNSADNPADLVKTTYQSDISLAYTPDTFLCKGTGDSTGCIRKRFVYHLPDGRNILAEIAFWPYGSADLQKQVKAVVKVYEDALTK